MTTTPQTEAEQDVPLPDGFIMDGLPDGRIEYKRGFLRESDSLLRSCAPAWEARSIYRLHKELRRLDAENQRQRADLERKSEAIQRLWAERDQLRAQVERLQGGDPAVRFCPGCGSVGAVPYTYKDCCPDGNHARMIPESLARRCNDLFYLALNAAQSASQEPVTLTDRQIDLICQAIDKADTITMDGDYMMDSVDCIAVVRVMQALFDIAAQREKQGGA